MSQETSDAFKDQYTDCYEVNADDFEAFAGVEGFDDCIVLSDEENHGVNASDPVVNNGELGDVAIKEEVPENTAVVKAEDDDDSEDDNEDEQAEQERANVDPGFFADELELLELTLPPQTLIKDRAVKMWNLRKLIVYPVSEDELQTSEMNQLLKDPHCSQVIIHIDREKPSSDNRCSFLDLVFDSKDGAVKATEALKTISSQFKILNAANVDEWKKDFDESRSVHFSGYESKKWPSCLVCVKYLPHNITEEKLREIFPDAFEVLIYMNDRPNLTETQRLTAFLFYGTPEEAKDVIQSNNEKKTSVDGVRLAFFKYDQISHPQLISPSLMAMSERYVILKEKRKVEKLAKIRGGHCATTLEKFNTKLKEDETIRSMYGLPTPTVEEMRTIPNLKILRGVESFKVVKQKGLLWRNREKLLSAGPAALEAPVHPENKGLQSGITNPNKRKRRRIQLETKTTPFAGPRPTGPPSLLQTVVRQRQPVPRPPLQKVRRLMPETDFTSYAEEASYEADSTMYPELMYPTAQGAYAPPVRRLRPQMGHPRMARPLMPRGIAPRGMPPRGVPMARLMVSRPQSMTVRPAPLGAQPRAGRGLPMQPRMGDPLNSRLMRLAHGGAASSSSTISSSTTLTSAPRQLMAQVPRPRPSAFGGGTLAGPMRRPVMIGQRFPGPGMLIRRAPRPLGRAGWAVRH